MTMVASKRQPSVIEKFSPMLSRHAPLSREEEATATPKELILANMRFAAREAAKINYNMPLEDRLQCAFTGLIKAAKRFDPAQGNKFISYAVWYIRQEILMAIKQDHPVRIPINVQDDFLRAERASDRLRQMLGREPTIDEIAQHLDIPYDRIERAYATMQGALSLDKLIDEDFATKKSRYGSRTLYETVPDDAPLPDEITTEEMVADAVRQCVDDLPKRDKYILTRLFGLDGRAPEALAEIGETLKISRERVRQLKEKNFALLRKRLHKLGLGEETLL